jgi:Mg/Co/Ni transporter MgtE
MVRFVQKVFPLNKNRGKEFFMLNAIKVSLSRQEIIGAVKSMNKRDREDFLEELLATTSPEYLKSIKDARADYKAGRVKTHDEVFGR